MEECCFISSDFAALSCTSPAQYMILDAGKGAGDETYSCQKHLSDMIIGTCEVTRLGSSNG